MADGPAPDQSLSGKEVAGAFARAVATLARWIARMIRGQVVKRVGGPARARVIMIFGAVLALNGAEWPPSAPSRRSSRRRCNRQHEDRAAQLRHAARRRGLHDPGRPARRPGQADPDARGQHRAVEHRVAGQRVRGQLLTLLLSRLAARRRGRDRRPGDRVADRRLLPRERARQGVRVHPRRRGRPGPRSASSSARTPPA